MKLYLLHRLILTYLIEFEPEKFTFRKQNIEYSFMLNTKEIQFPKRLSIYIIGFVEYKISSTVFHVHFRES